MRHFILKVLISSVRALFDAPSAPLPLGGVATCAAPATLLVPALVQASTSRGTTKAGHACNVASG